MYSQSLLITGIAYEAMKRDAIARGTVICDRAIGHLSAAVDAYDKKHGKAAECDGTIMCERIGVRHKADCIGKVEPIAVFWRKVQQ